VPEPVRKRKEKPTGRLGLKFRKMVAKKQTKNKKTVKDRSQRRMLLLTRLEALQPATAEDFAEDKRAWNIVRRSFPGQKARALACLRTFFVDYHSVGLPTPTCGRDGSGRFASSAPPSHFVEEFAPEDWSEEARQQLRTLLTTTNNSFSSKTAGVAIDVGRP
jgi:hypothetical protein